MKDLAFLTSPDMSKAEVVTNHIVIAQYAGLNKISVRKLIDNNKQDLEELGILSFEMTKPIQLVDVQQKFINSIVTKLCYLLHG